MDDNNYTLPAGLVEAMIETLGHLPYGQVFDLIHTASRMVHEQREAQAPKIITGERP